MGALGKFPCKDSASSHFLQTAEHLTLASLTKTSEPEKTKGDRSQSEFAEDPSIPVQFRARLKDYLRSGYDRGHM
jgi:endonuclease G